MSVQKPTSCMFGGRIRDVYVTPLPDTPRTKPA
jgi:hypothetical protein